MNNFIIKTDSYKVNHWMQYPAGTEFVYSYLEARAGARFDKTAIVGLQPLLKRHLVGTVITENSINQARFMVACHFGQADSKRITPYVCNTHVPIYVSVPLYDDEGNVRDIVQAVNPDLRVDWEKYFADTNQKERFNIAGWTRILKVHGGKLPLRIKAAPEGLPIPVSNVLMTVENTDKENSYWLTNAVESLLTHVWHPCTVNALSREVKMLCTRFAERTSDSPMVNFMLHDFGYRGVSGDEAARMGGMAHIVNFMGTDTMVAMEFAINYYGATMDGLAYSVPATEHSIMTALGEDGEEAVVERLLEQYPDGILSVVADSYDIYNFVDVIVGQKFKKRILERKGVFVVRPDSITPTHQTPEAEMVWIMSNLWINFGGTTNRKGYKVLNPAVRVLWGDGIDYDGIHKILKAVEFAGFSIDNIATFGMGGGLLQKVNRDTQRFAFKSSAQCRDGVWHDIYKKPKDVTKASKRGRLKLVKDVSPYGFVYVTVPESDPRPDVLEVVFENGHMVKTYTWEEVRKNAELQPYELL